MQQTIEKWIRSGYKVLGTQGLDALKIEALARALKLNKSGFYHYFGNMEGFLKSLLQHHVAMARMIADEIAQCEAIDPDLLLLITHRKEFFLVNSQLLMKTRRSDINALVDEAENIISKAVVSLWQQNYDASTSPVVAQAYLHIIWPYLYTCISSGTITYDYLHTLTIETKTIFEKVINNYSAK